MKRFEITGLAVVFGGLDLSGEFFDNKTDFNLDLARGELPLYFDHGMDQVIGKQRVGKGTLTADVNGIRFDGVVEAPDRVAATLKRLIEGGALGLSSGSMSHLTEKEKLQDGRVRIKLWTLSEISLTSSPAEVRTSVSLKHWRALINHYRLKHQLQKSEILRGR